VDSPDRILRFARRTVTGNAGCSKPPVQSPDVQNHN
jgi:hypothetical protein